MIRVAMRNGLVGALLFVLLGSVQGCGGDDVSGPASPAPPAVRADATQEDAGPCYWVNGKWFCP